MSGQALDFMWGVWNQGLLTFTVWGPIVALFRVVNKSRLAEGTRRTGCAHHYRAALNAIKLKTP